MSDDSAEYHPKNPPIFTPFQCPVCNMISHHPKDAEHGYCGNCHAFTATYHHEFVGGDGRKWTDKSGSWEPEEPEAP